MADRPWFKYWPKGVPQHVDYPEIPLFELLSQAARRWPENVAFGCREQRLTYKKLDELTARLATGLHDLGVKTGDRVMLFLPNSLEFIIGYYGILRAGATVTTANPLYLHTELKRQLNDTEAVAIMTNRDLYPIVQKVRAETRLKIIISSDAQGNGLALTQILERYPPNPPEFVVKPKDDVAVILATGGTTGLSKGVLLTHYNLVANAIQNATWFHWSPADTVIGLLPFYHSWGATAGINSAIYSGARVIVMRRFDGKELLETVESERATVLYGVATMFVALVNDPAIGQCDISTLRYVKAGGMPIPPQIKERWEQLTKIRMVLGYGLSEASPETHNSPLERIKPGTVGIPIMDTDARIVDEETGEVELPPGQVGELVVRGPQVMKGYLNRPEDDRGALRNGWLYTGDLALMDEEGYVKIVDRKKETIKYKGYTIAPAEVEAVLYQHPGVRECAVVGKPDPLAGELPKAYVVLNEGVSVDEEELIEFCKERLAPYKRIREVEFIDEIPKTPVGKVLRRVLRDRERSH